MKNILTILFLITIVFSSCVEPINKSYSKLPPGIWRGVLVLDNKTPIIDTDKEFVEKTDFSGELPFNFEVTYTDEENFNVSFYNANEKFVVDDIKYGRDRATAKDTIEIHFADFDTYLSAVIEDHIMEGYWHVNYKDGYTVPFKATHGMAHRFTTLKKSPKADLSGKWDVKFNFGSENEYPAIGEFKQDGNHITGTFMTETGDYRFLEGTVQDNKFSLSTFDAAHAFLFDGKIMDDGSLLGSFRSGKHYKTTWSATKNPDAVLKDAFDLTSSTIGDETFDFTFDDLEGNPVSLSDDRFNNKIKLVKITGTWCPNCKDESIFLKDYIQNNPSEDIEVIEVAFEYYKDVEKAKTLLKNYTTKLDLPFTVLYGGIASKALTSEKFPQLSKVISYPTLIFVDKENKIRNIHTGFAGPATSEFPKFKKKFDQIIENIRA